MKYKLMNEEIFILRSRDTIFVFKSAYEPNSEINKVCWFETNSRKICWWWKYRNISEDGLNLKSMWWFRLSLFSGDGRPPGGSRGRSQGRRLLCRGPRWHHDHLQEEGGSLIWWLAWCLTWWLACLVDATIGMMNGMMADRDRRGWTWWIHGARKSTYTESKSCSVSD